ncbi:hypothetical protein BOX15_Mlig023847g1, partial [Macrostomum lignano]
SWFGLGGGSQQQAGRPPSGSPDERLLVSQQMLEVEMMQDLYNRVMESCNTKCVQPSYNDTELTKAEAVCIDRCVAKYMELHEVVGNKLQQISQQQSDTAAKAAAAVQQSGAARPTGS